MYVIQAKLIAVMLTSRFGFMTNIFFLNIFIYSTSICQKMKYQLYSAIYGGYTLLSLVMSCLNIPSIFYGTICLILSFLPLLQHYRKSNYSSASRQIILPIKVLSDLILCEYFYEDMVLDFSRMGFIYFISLFSEFSNHPLLQAQF